MDKGWLCTSTISEESTNANGSDPVDIHPLQEALEGQDWASVILLAAKLPDKTTLNKWVGVYHSPLDFAVSTKAPLEIISLLITPENVNQITDSGWSPLMMIICHPDKSDALWDVVRRMLQNNADVNNTGKPRNSVLHRVILC